MTKSPVKIKFHIWLVFGQNQRFRRKLNGKQSDMSKRRYLHVARCLKMSVREGQPYLTKSKRRSVWHVSVPIVGLGDGGCACYPHCLLGSIYLMYLEAKHNGACELVSNTVPMYLI